MSTYNMNIIVVLVQSLPKPRDVYLVNSKFYPGKYVYYIFSDYCNFSSFSGMYIIRYLRSM